MSYLEYENKPQRSKLSYFVVALIAAIIGGLISISIFVFVVQEEFWGQSGYDIKQSPEINIPQGNLDLSPVVSIAEKVGPTVVGISNRGNIRDFWGRTMTQEQGSGSGVVIDSKGYIVTNYHVVKDANEIIVSLSDGKKIEGKLVGADPKTDLAVLKINADNLPVATLGDSSKIRTGELVVAIGNPLGIEFARSVTAGIVSATNRTLSIGDEQFNLIQTDAAINPGNSGGALVNSKGEVIGINSVKLVIQGVEGMGFAIPISKAKPIIEDLIQKGYVSRPYLGIRGLEIDEPTAEKFDLPQGILVKQLEIRGPAQRAGIKENDIITEIDKQKVFNFSDLTIMLDNKKPGDEIIISVYRDGKNINLSLVLGELPQE
ncbi:MAG: S1C family serine protease [Bacillota bacterium]